MREERDFMDAVRKLYKQNQSLQKTAEEVGAAYGKIRKILITLGEYKTPFSERVIKLKGSGMSISEIAEKEKCSINKVAAYLPYERGIYKALDQTLDAQKSKRYRSRIEVAVRNQVTRKYAMESSRGIYKKEGKSNMHKNNQREKDIYPVRLHLELYNEHLEDEEIRTLIKYGDATERGSLTRDILIPSDMPLHHLHYAIQRLFGWQNSHLRCFQLLDEDHNRLTGGSVKGWMNLVGVLFKGLPEDQSDQFWDDHYMGGSFKVWLKQKYTGPYSFEGYTEDYGVAQRSVQALAERNQEMEVRESFHDNYERTRNSKNEKDEPIRILRKAPMIELSLEELHNSLIIEEGTYRLLERLEVTSVLALPETSLADAKGLGGSRAIPSYEVNHGTHYMDERPAVFPVAHKLIYNYDFGDNWLIEISRMKDCSDLLKTGELTEEGLKAAEQTVIEKHKPVCISKRGGYVMDDVGGMHGYAQFLNTIYESDDKQEKQEHRQWAEGQGWSGRKVSLEKML